MTQVLPQTIDRVVADGDLATRDLHQSGAWLPSFSANGQRLVFSTNASLVPEDTNGVADIYLKDFATGALVRVSTGANGVQGNGASLWSTLSSDGTKLLFGSAANNLVAGDTNGQVDIFLKDLVTGTIQRVSTKSDGTEAHNGESAEAYLSFSPVNQNVVLFSSLASDLVAGDTNGTYDVFMKHMVTGAVQRISLASDGVTQGNGYSMYPMFSPDGTKVVFYSDATNLVPGDTNGALDAFMKDLNSGALTRVSTSSSGAQADADTNDARFSPDGRYIYFTSIASNLVPGDTNNRWDIFRKDIATGEVIRVSVTADGSEATGGTGFPGAPWASGSWMGNFSADGRYLTFMSDASNLVPGDTNGTYDIFVKDLTTGAVARVSTDTAGAQANNLSFGGLVSSNGQYIAFESLASNLVPGDTNDKSDFFRVSNPFFAVPSNAGTLDLSFGGKGYVLTDFTLKDDRAYAIALQPDGQILVAGTAGSANQNFAVARYNVDGSLDSTFGSSGKVMTDFGGTSDIGYGVALQPDGRIVVVGQGSAGANLDFAIARYNTNGNPDLSFSGDGKLLTNMAGGNETAHAVAIQPDGKILVAGGGEVGGGADFMLARYNSDGSPDVGFSGDGVAFADFGGGGDFGYGVALQPDGKIIVAGRGGQTSNYDFALVRFNANGTPDASFGTSGKVLTDFGSGLDRANAVALQPDGKIVVVGESLSIGSDFDVAVARYNANGSLDSTFSSDGKVTIDFSHGTDYGEAVSIQPDGKIIVAGSASNGANMDAALLRFNSDGTLDTSFSADGKLLIDVASADNWAYGVALQSNGRILVAGQAWNGTNYDFSVARVNGGFTDTFNSVTLEAARVDLELAKYSVIAYEDTAYTTVVGGWSPVKDFSVAPTFGTYSNGVFRSADGVAAAHLYIGMVGNEKTLILAFRGTDALSDIPTYLENFGVHWDLLKGFVSQVDNYIAAYGIDKVYVTGHSLGGAMAEKYMAEHPGTASGPLYEAVTFAAPGIDDSAQTQVDFRITNFAVIGDPIAAYQFHRGTTIFLETGLGSSDPIAYHRVALYHDLVGFFTDEAVSAGQSIEELCVRLGNPREHVFYAQTEQVAGGYAIATGDEMVPAPNHDSRFAQLPYAIFGGAGDDTLFGTEAYGPNLNLEKNDVLLGGAGHDTLQGLGGNDHLAGGPGNDALYGGIGIDTALYSGPRASYGMTPSAADYSVSGPEGTDVLSGIERLQFSDGILALDTQSGGHTFDAYALFNAGFNRAPTVAEISRWTAERDQSFDINALAQKMIDFYAPGISDEALVKHLYFTITGTPAPQSAIDLYTGLITNGTYTQASLLSMAAQLDLNTNEFVSLIGQGVALDPSYFGG
jgi:uncharacterized delta-60 repeat protein